MSRLDGVAPSVDADRRDVTVVVIVVSTVSVIVVVAGSVVVDCKPQVRRRVDPSVFAKLTHIDGGHFDQLLGNKGGQRLDRCHGDRR